MKYYRNYVILCLIFLLSFGFFNSNFSILNFDSNENKNTASNTNLNFHSNNNFFTLEIADNITFDCDSNFENLEISNTYKIKEKSKIKFHYSPNAVQNNSILFAHTEYLGFDINGKFYEFDYFETHSIELSCDLNVKIKTIEYDFLGLGFYQNTSIDEITLKNFSSKLNFNNNQISSSDKLLFYITLDNNMKSVSNTTYDLENINNSLFVDVEIYSEIKSISTFAIYSNGNDVICIFIGNTILNTTKNLTGHIEIESNLESVNRISVNFLKSIYEKR